MSRDETASTAVVVRRAPRWMWVLMVLSLAVNVLVVGVVVGSVWAVRRGGFWDTPVAVGRLVRFMGGLSPDRRVELRAVFVEHRVRLRPFWREVRQTRRKLARMIAAGGYSREELNAALDDLAVKEAKAKAASRPMVLALLAKLRPGERLHFLSVFMPYLDNVQNHPEIMWQ